MHTIQMKHDRSLHAWVLSRTDAKGNQLGDIEVHSNLRDAAHAMDTWQARYPRDRVVVPPLINRYMRLTPMAA